MKKVLPILVFVALVGCTQGPPAPVLHFPPEGYELTTMPFFWSTVPEATEYSFQISKDLGFADMIINEVTTDTFYSVASKYELFEDGSIYYWRVSSGNGEAWGKSSEIRTISVRII